MGQLARLYMHRDLYIYKKKTTAIYVVDDQDFKLITVEKIF